jgi:galactonate dehydratase
VHTGINITEILGGTKQTRVPIYANINRSLFQGKRSPRDFALAAEKAVTHGFSTIKCAPFDEVNDTFDSSNIMDTSKLGLKRVALMRDAIGKNVTLLVDCHGRFTRDTSILIAQELCHLNIGWLEEPIPTDNTETLAEIAKQIPIPLAGGESGYGKIFFDDLIHTNASHIIMPDIKFCGGIVEAYKSGKHALQSSAQVSLHNPSGPVSQLASAHVTAAMTGSAALEYPVGEADWRTNLIHPPENAHSGFFWFPDGTGIGASLNNDLISHHGTTWEI